MYKIENKGMKIAVFCASADKINNIYKEEARKLGQTIGQMKWHLVYGGTNIGLMRVVADATMIFGGDITGIIPECIHKRGVAAKMGELIVVPDMKERKHLLREGSDAFIALPGGWGTLEEITEVITLKQLGQHDKPIVFLNTAGYYDRFLDFISEAGEEGFISRNYDQIYLVTDSVEKAIEYIRTYQKQEIKGKY